MSLRDRNGHIDTTDLDDALRCAREADDAIRAAGFGNHHLAKRLHAAVLAADAAHREITACERLIRAVSRDQNNNVYDLTGETLHVLSSAPPLMEAK